MKYNFRFNSINGMFSSNNKYFDRLKKCIFNFSYDDDDEKKGSGLGKTLLTAGLGAAAGYAAANSGIFNGGNSGGGVGTGSTGSTTAPNPPPTQSTPQPASNTAIQSNTPSTPPPPKPEVNKLVNTNQPTVPKVEPPKSTPPKPSPSGSEMNPPKQPPAQSTPPQGPKVETPKSQTKVNSPSVPKPSNQSNSTTSNSNNDGPDEATRAKFEEASKRARERNAAQFDKDGNFRARQKGESAMMYNHKRRMAEMIRTRNAQEDALAASGVKPTYTRNADGSWSRSINGKVYGDGKGGWTTDSNKSLAAQMGMNRGSVTNPKELPDF